jgi:hypothetical protein
MLIVDQRWKGRIWMAANGRMVNELEGIGRRGSGVLDQIRKREHPLAIGFASL